MASWSRESVLTFIELYKSFECLWKIKSKAYCNRSLKDKAYDKLVKFVHQFDKTASRETVTNKINALRTNFRKELKKVGNSKTSGAAEEEVYVPKLWYYDEMLFLVDLELPQSSTSNIGMGCQHLHCSSHAGGIKIKTPDSSEGGSKPTARGAKKDTTLAVDNQLASSQQENIDGASVMPKDSSKELQEIYKNFWRSIKDHSRVEETSTSSTVTVVSESEEGCSASEEVQRDYTHELLCVAKREMTDTDNKSNEDVEGHQKLESSEMEISLVSSSSGDISSQTLIAPSAQFSYSSTTVPSPNESTQATKRKAADELLTPAHDHLKMPDEDEHDAFAKTVAFKLRKLNPVQCFFAEKLINDVLYEAGLGELSRMSYIRARSETAPFIQYVASGHDEV